MATEPDVPPANVAVSTTGADAPPGRSHDAPTDPGATPANPSIDRSRIDA